VRSRSTASTTSDFLRRFRQTRFHPPRCDHDALDESAGLEDDAQRRGFGAGHVECLD
jgi:hypothetical protein